MVYVLLVERVERAALTERQVCATLRAAGAKVDIAPVEDARLALDAALVAAPENAKVTDPEQLQLRRALGVA